MKSQFWIWHILDANHPALHLEHSCFIIKQATISKQLSKLPIIMPLPSYFSYFHNTAHTWIHGWQCQHCSVSIQKCLSFTGAFRTEQLPPHLQRSLLSRNPPEWWRWQPQLLISASNSSGMGQAPPSLFAHVYFLNVVVNLSRNSSIMWGNYRPELPWRPNVATWVTPFRGLHHMRRAEMTLTIKKGGRNSS